MLHSYWLTTKLFTESELTKANAALDAFSLKREFCFNWELEQHQVSEVSTWSFITLDGLREDYWLVQAAATLTWNLWSLTGISSAHHLSVAYCLHCAALHYFPAIILTTLLSLSLLLHHAEARQRRMLSSTNVAASLFSHPLTEGQSCWYCLQKPHNNNQKIISIQNLMHIISLCYECKTKESCSAIVHMIFYRSSLMKKFVILPPILKYSIGAGLDWSKKTWKVRESSLSLYNSCLWMVGWFQPCKHVLSVHWCFLSVHIARHLWIKKIPRL